MTLKPGLEYRINHFLWNGLDLFFPPSCGGCGKPGSRWCKECQQLMMPVPSPICQKCGNPLSEPGSCSKCARTQPVYLAMRSCFVYTDPVRPAIIKLKYHREVGLGEAVAVYMAKYLLNSGWQADIVLPIPLSAQRFAERGYNQVNLIAHPLARYIGWKYVPGAIHRTRHTISQVGLDAGERRKNVNGAFQAESKIVNGKTVLLIDDVATTGSTIDSASQALIDAGAKYVLALTFARAMPKFGMDFPVKSLPSRSLR